MGKTNFSSKSFSTKSFSTKTLRKKRFTAVDINDFFAAVGDIPLAAQIFYNNFFATLYINNLSSKFLFGLSFPPTQTNSKGLIDLVSATTQSSYGDTVSTAPFNTKGSTCAPCQGMILDSSVTATSYIKSGFIPNIRNNIYSHCTIQIPTTTLGVSANYDNGAFNSSSQACTMNNNYTGGNQRTQRYNNTGGQGLFSAAGSTGAPGAYWSNTNASNFVEWGFDAIQRGTGSTNGGTQPTIQKYIGCLNNAGGPGTIVSQVIGGYFEFSGLTTVERAIAVAACKQLVSDLGRFSTSWTRKIVVDGNSHTTYWNEKIYRTIQYNLFGNNIQFVNFGVSGQTTTQMISDEGTQIAGAYNATYAHNLLIAYEFTNDMYVGGKTVAQAFNNMQTYCTNALGYGYSQVFVKKSFCRGAPINATYPTITSWNLAVDQLNALLVPGCFGANVTILPVDATHFIARSGYGSDALYNTAVAALLAANTLDGTHLPEIGYKTEAELDVPIITPFL